MVKQEGQVILKSKIVSSSSRLINFKIKALSLHPYSLLRDLNIAVNEVGSD